MRFDRGETIYELPEEELASKSGRQRFYAVSNYVTGLMDIEKTKIENVLNGKENVKKQAIEGIGEYYSQDRQELTLNNLDTVADEITECQYFSIVDEGIENVRVTIDNRRDIYDDPILQACGVHTRISYMRDLIDLKKPFYIKYQGRLKKAVKEQLMQKLSSKERVQFSIMQQRERINETGRKVKSLKENCCLIM